MPSALGQSQQSTTSYTSELGAHDLLLLRIAAGGARRVDLQRDVAPLLAHKLPGSEFRRTAESAIATFVNAQIASDEKGQITLRPKGAQVASALLGTTRSPASWGDVTKALVIRALAAKDTPQVRKAIDSAEGLAALVLQQHFKIPVASTLSPADLRAALAIVALERAFGNRIKTGFAKGSGLPAKAGRVLAAQLFRNPREVSSDGKLVLGLAAEVVGAKETSREAIELALLRRVTGAATAPVPVPSNMVARPKPQPPKAANDRAPLPTSDARPATAKSPPDMAEFVGAVLEAARPVAEGWPGNRKAFISLVWKAIRHARPDWGLSEIAFKGMLAEAHRSGRLELATADLKDGRDKRSLEDSRIYYKNTVWHFVRVEP
jgi:hypothetical protein